MKDRSHKQEKLREEFLLDIYERELVCGEPVGSLRKLAMRYSTTPQTVARMFADLVDAGILSRNEQGMYCVQQPPLCKPKLGYAGDVLLTPGNVLDCLAKDAAKVLFAELEKLNTPPRIIGYHELLSPEIAFERLNGLNGLLIASPFVDNRTAGVLRQLQIPVVRIGQTFSQDNEMNCSEVVQYLEPALEEFADYCDLASYRRIINLQGDHSNALALRENINDFLKRFNPNGTVENITIHTPRSGQAELEAFCAFMEMDCRDWSDTLIISGSGFFSRGLCRALRQKHQTLPDILCIDNFEGYEKSSVFPEPYLTAIDRNMSTIYRDAARLLVDQVRNNDKRKVIIKVPAKLIIRQSITHTKYNVEHNKRG